MTKNGFKWLKKSFNLIWIQIKTFLEGVLEKWHFPSFVIKTSVLINLWNYPARWNGRVGEKIRERITKMHVGVSAHRWTRNGLFALRWEEGQHSSRWKIMQTRIKERGGKSLCGSETAAAEGIICSYNTFSPIIVTEVWLENVKSGLVQLKRSPQRSLVILISGIGCLNRMTNYILSSLIQSLPLFFSCSVRLPAASLSPCLSLFQLEGGVCSEYLNKLKSYLSGRGKKKLP